MSNKADGGITLPRSGVGEAFARAADRFRMSSANSLHVSNRAASSKVARTALSS